MLQRLDHRAGIEPEHPREPGALHPPLLPRRHRLLLEVGEHVARPVDLVRLSQVAAQAGDPPEDVASASDHVKCAGIEAPVLVNHEVGVGGLHERVILGGLNVPLAGVQKLSRDQRLVEGIGQGKKSSHAGTAVEEVHARGSLYSLVEVRTAAVVADIVEGDVERRYPEELGLRQLGLGDPDPGLRRRHDQWPRVGEPQGGSQVDRESEVRRLEGRGLELEGGSQGRRGRLRRDVAPGQGGKRWRQGLRQIAAVLVHPGSDSRARSSPAASPVHPVLRNARCRRTPTTAASWAAPVDRPRGRIDGWGLRSVGARSAHGAASTKQYEQGSGEDRWSGVVFPHDRFHCVYWFLRLTRGMPADQLEVAGKINPASD